MKLNKPMFPRLNHLLDTFFSGLRKVLSNPYVNLVIGIAMFISSLNGIQGTLWTDLVKFNFRVHHGMALMGTWKIFEALPNIYGTLDWIKESRKINDAPTDSDTHKEIEGSASNTVARTAERCRDGSQR